MSEAEDFLAVQSYDAMVLDVNLPDGTGTALLRAMRGRGDRTPVLMLTANSAVEDRVGALDLGADDYLVKPFDQRELEATAPAGTVSAPAPRASTITSTAPVEAPAEMPSR